MVPPQNPNYLLICFSWQQIHNESETTPRPSASTKGLVQPTPRTVTWPIKILTPNGKPRDCSVLVTTYMQVVPRAFVHHSLPTCTCACTCCEYLLCEYLLFTQVNCCGMFLKKTRVLLLKAHEAIDHVVGCFVETFNKWFDKARNWFNLKLVGGMTGTDTGWLHKTLSHKSTNCDWEFYHWPKQPSIYSLLQVHLTSFMRIQKLRNNSQTLSLFWFWPHISFWFTNLSQTLSLY